MSRWRALTFVVLGLAAATAGLFAILMLGFSEGHTARLVEAADVISGPAEINLVRNAEPGTNAVADYYNWLDGYATPAWMLAALALVSFVAQGLWRPWRWLLYGLAAVPPVMAVLGRNTRLTMLEMAAAPPDMLTASQWQRGLESWGLLAFTSVLAAICATQRRPLLALAMAGFAALLWLGSGLTPATPSVTETAFFAWIPVWFMALKETVFPPRP